MALIDEIIKITLNLSDNLQVPRQHREFALLVGMTEDKKILTRGSFEEDIKDIGLSAKVIEYIKVWFSSGGVKLTLYNVIDEEENRSALSVNIAELKIDEHNIIMSAIDDPISIYNMLSDSIKANKNFIFKASSTEVANMPKGRNITVMLYEQDNSEAIIYEYFAPYTVAGRYRKNNFESSNLAGSNLTTLDLLVTNQVGALVYFPEFNGSKYQNIVSRIGLDYNLNILSKDIEYDIKTTMLASLSAENKYNQSLISRLELQMAEVGKKYLSANLIQGYDTASLPFSQQTAQNIKNGNIAGFTFSYNPTTEGKTAEVNINEEI